jgi:NTE family protein
VNAVRLDDGTRVTFGRDAPPVDVATAVAASCAIPAFFEPVVVDGVRYVDGGTHSPTNADLVADRGFDLVIVSSPMSIAGNRLRVAPDQPFRRMARLTLARLVGRVRRRGTPVIVFQPTPAEVGAMGLNAMDPARRADVTRNARESARRRLERNDARDAVSVLRRV